MLISVIVPIYNVERYLCRCIDSILRQSFGDFELILIDDGSPDRCGMICDEYKNVDNRITVIHQKNGGLSAARNTGIDYVLNKKESQWISFIDSDDWIHRDYLLHLYAACIDSKTQISMCRFNRTADIIEDEDCPSKSAMIMDARDALITSDGIAAFACGRLFSIDCFRENRFPEGVYMEDFYIIPKIMMESKQIAVVDEQLYYYYINENSILGKLTFKKFYDAWDGIEKQIELFTKYHEESLVRMQANSLVRNICAGLDFISLHPRENKGNLKYTKMYGKLILKKYAQFISVDNKKALRTYVDFIPRITRHTKQIILLLIKGEYHKAQNIYRKNYKKVYTKIKRWQLRNQNFSIICCNCIGGFIYHRLGERFLTPTINCFINPKDFVKFCNNLKYYISQDLIFVESDRDYPVARLDDIYVYFNHSDSVENARNDWNKRKTRINYDNLYIIAYDQFSRDEEKLEVAEIRMLQKAPCNNMVVLSEYNYPDIPYVLSIPKKGQGLGELYFETDEYGIYRFEREFDYVRFLNKK